MKGAELNKIAVLTKSIRLMRNRITKSQGDEIFVGGYGVDSGVVMWLIVNQIGLGSTNYRNFIFVMQHGNDPRH